MKSEAGSSARGIARYDEHHMRGSAWTGRSSSLMLAVAWAASLAVPGCGEPNSDSEVAPVTGALNVKKHRKTTRTFAAIDARGIREFPGGEPFLLDFLAIKEGTSDRTVIQFDLSAIKGDVVDALLNLGIENFDRDNADEGRIDIFTFAGNGTVTPDQFTAGTFFDSFVYDGGAGTISVDITDAVRAHIAAGDRFLGLRLTAGTSDRFFLGASIMEPEPSLTVTTRTAAPKPDCHGKDRHHDDDWHLRGPGRP
jgi:hypothetical protein